MKSYTLSLPEKEMYGFWADTGGIDMNGFYWIYLIMLGLTMCYHFSKNHEQKRLIYWGACGFLLLLFVVQDSSVSVDTAEYMRQYEIIPTLSFSQMLTHKFEIGFVLLCRILDALFEGRRVLLLMMSLLIMIPFARSFERDTEQPMVAMMAFLALGMYQQALVFIRQLAAMAILTWGYDYIVKRKPWYFLLSVLLAMTFHKMSFFFVLVYILYGFPVNKWLFMAAAAAAVIGGVFCQSIMSFILAYVYEYHPMYHISDGGENLLLVLWVMVLLSYWLLGDRMSEPKIKLPFIMLLIAAALQPICFAFYTWFRVVLFFRIALVPLCSQLYTSLFCRKEGNRVLMLLKRYAPGVYPMVLTAYDTKWFQAAAQVLLFAVLFVWYLSELERSVYYMAPFG